MENPRLIYAAGLRARPALLVRGSSRRITMMRFRPANIRVINRRNSRLGHLRCCVLSNIEREEKKERIEEQCPDIHQRAGLTGSFHIRLGLGPSCLVRNAPDRTTCAQHAGGDGRRAGLKTEIAARFNAEIAEPAESLIVLCELRGLGVDVASAPSASSAAPRH
jgi:hypothetical protein